MDQFSVAVVGHFYIAANNDDEDVINDLMGSSITYCVAVGKNKGKKLIRFKRYQHNWKTWQKIKR